MKLLFRYLSTLLFVFSFIFVTNTSALEKFTHLSIEEFEKDIDLIYRELDQKNSFNMGNCDRYISKITNFILLRGGRRYLPFDHKDFKRLDERGEIILEKLFLLRLRLRERLREFYLQKSITPSCVRKIRVAFRYSRFVEEFITETIVNRDKSLPKANHREFTQQKYQFYQNPKYPNFQFRSGDIIIVRTSSFVSAIISRIGDVAGQFSHAALLYIDDKGEKKIIEALNSEGVVIVPFEEWQTNDQHARAVLFRHPDTALAKRAAQRMHDSIQKRWLLKDPIPYDFKMSPKTDEFFCSELVQYAYRLGGEDGIPAFPTKFHAFKNHTFLEDITIEATEAFAPSDLEIEPAVDLVAEWRHYGLTKVVRMEDAIQTKVLYWMSRKDYYLKDSFTGMLGATIGVIGRRYLGLNRNTIPLNMPYGFIKNLIELHDINKILEGFLHTKEDEYFAKHGNSMDYLTMMRELEKLRVDDCNRYVQREKEVNSRILHHIEDIGEPYRSPEPLFHNLFNKKDGLECNSL